MENKPAYDEMLEMRNKGMTYQEIADEFGVSKQWVNYILTHCYEGYKGQRGKGFDIEKIVYKGIYEHFKKNLFESVTSFTEKVLGNSATYVAKMRNLITGQHNTGRNQSQKKVT